MKLIAIVCVLITSCIAQVGNVIPERQSGPVFTARAASDYGVSPNVVYGVAGGHELRLDVYQRKDERVAPVVVQIHGGGWVEGSKEQDQLQVLPWLEMGYDVVNGEYRLGGVAG